MTQPDENEAQAAPDEPSSPTLPTIISDNDPSTDDDGGLIFGWINGDPGPISAWPCTGYSHAGGGPRQHSDPPDAVVKKRSFEAAGAVRRWNGKTQSDSENERHQATIEDC